MASRERLRKNEGEDARRRRVRTRRRRANTHIHTRLFFLLVGRRPRSIPLLPPFYSHTVREDAIK